MAMRTDDVIVLYVSLTALAERQFLQILKEIFFL